MSVEVLLTFKREIIASIVQNMIFGDYKFFDRYFFEGYFQSKYKLSKKQFLYSFYSLTILVLSFIGFQVFIFKNILLEMIVIEIILVIALLRLINYIINLQFKEYCSDVETIGYFVVNELLVILETSRSLKEATKFVILSEYPVFSEIFKCAMMETHFGIPLELALQIQINKHLHGNIRFVFQNILEVWENGTNFALLSKKRILSRISERITEETDKIDSWASLSSGITYLCPPVILCFLLISGKMSVILGLVIISGIIFGSYFFHPERHLTLFSNNNQLFHVYGKNSLEFLVVLSENLSRGISFYRSLNNAMNIILKQSQSNDFVCKSETFIQFRVGSIQKHKADENYENFLCEFLPERTIQLVSLTQKFSMIDTIIAGQKLLKITEELNKTNEIINRSIVRLKAAKFHGTIIQILSLISLAFIAGASPIFLFVSNMLNMSVTEPIKNVDNPIFEIVYLIMALTISVLPLKRVNFKNSNKPNTVPWGEIIKLSKFVFFVALYILVKDFFSGMY